MREVNIIKHWMCTESFISDVLWFFIEHLGFLFLQVALYFDKFTGVCQNMLHECKLNFLRIVSDHDLFVEMPGRDPTERYGL